MSLITDGSKDENVFDIRQGVSIALFIKKKDIKQDCKVYHSELWGLRDEKYEQLANNDFKTIKWQKINPKSEFYLFIPRDESLEEEYCKYFKISDIFPINGVGMTTARDSFVVDRDKNKLLKRIQLFKNNEGSDDELHQTFNINKKKGWSIRKAWNMLQSTSDSEIENLIVPVLYRPFDIQWIFYHDSLVWRTVKKIMPHMQKENIGLITVRQVAEGIFNHSLVTNNIIESRITLSNKGIAFIYPLFLYNEYEKNALFNDLENNKTKQPNINPEIFIVLRDNFKNQTPTPEQIFYYIYAVLYSNIYRKKYAEFLKIDFPRIPFTKDYDLFIKLGKLGKELAEIHLMKSPQLNKTFSRFEVSGDNQVAKVNYEEKKVYINKTQNFSNIDKNIWEYQIGGYQVIHKWLKDRKGKTLTLEDIQHYIKIAKVLQLTIEYQKKIDDLYLKVEKNLINLNINSKY